MGNHHNGSKTFRLLRQDSILRRIFTHPSHLPMDIVKLHHMAMIQMLLLRKRMAMGVRPRIQGNITVVVPIENPAFAFDVP